MGCLQGRCTVLTGDVRAEGSPMSKCPQEPTTITSRVGRFTRSIMQSFKLGSNGAWEQRSTSQTSHANSAPTSSNTQRSEGLSLSEDKGEAPPEPIRDPIRKPAKGE